MTPTKKLPAKKSLGQHFLRSPKTIAKMIEVSEIKTNDTILEIGPGEGVLTKALLETGAKIVAIEADMRLVEVLKNKFAYEIDTGKLVLIHGDALLHTETIKEKFKMVANIPYYITGEILRKFLTSENAPKSVTLLVQKEVAYRIASDPKESILSLSIKAYGTPKYVDTVPARYFFPAPKVDSAIMQIAGISKEFFNGLSEKEFFRVVKIGFSSRRKKLLNNLSNVWKREYIKNIFALCDIDENARAEDLNVEKWKNVAKNIAKID